MKKRHANVDEAARDIIHGAGGWLEFEKYEAVVSDDRDVSIVAFALRCLANTEYAQARELVTRLAIKHGLIDSKPDAD